MRRVRPDVVCCDLQIAEYEAYISSDIAQLMRDADLPPMLPEGTLADTRGWFGRAATRGEHLQGHNSSIVLMYRYTRASGPCSPWPRTLLGANPCPARRPLGHLIYPALWCMHAASTYRHGPLAAKMCLVRLPFRLLQGILSSRNQSAEAWRRHVRASCTSATRLCSTYLEFHIWPPFPHTLPDNVFATWRY
jgi:hypothetical protein